MALCLIVHLLSCEFKLGMSEQGKHHRTARRLDQRGRIDESQEGSTAGDLRYEE